MLEWNNFKTTSRRIFHIKSDHPTRQLSNDQGFTEQYIKEHVLSPEGLPLFSNGIVSSTLLDDKVTKIQSTRTWMTYPQVGTFPAPSPVPIPGPMPVPAPTPRHHRR